MRDVRSTSTESQPSRRHGKSYRSPGVSEKWTSGSKSPASCTAVLSESDRACPQCRGDLARCMHPNTNAVLNNDGISFSYSIQAVAYPRRNSREMRPGQRIRLESSTRQGNLPRYRIFVTHDAPSLGCNRRATESNARNDVCRCSHSRQFNCASGLHAPAFHRARGCAQHHKAQRTRGKLLTEKEQHARTREADSTQQRAGRERADSLRTCSFGGPQEVLQRL
jgi:hypothetical protein